MDAAAADRLRLSILRRHELLDRCERDEEFRALEMEMCRRDKVHWFNNWVWTYDPRAAAETFLDAQGLIRRKPTFVPFDLWPRQVDFVRWYDARVAAREDGLAEKSRDIGFTWLAGGCALHDWLWVDGFKATFGSRKAEFVDRIGDPDSIFEKIRLMLYRLPPWMRPDGFKRRRHDNHMRLLNPANEASIRGEGGDEMGRGGRSTVYVIDEAAFIEHAERVDGATSANTDTRIWGSSVNGMGNLFAKKRHDGSMRPDQIFRFHYSDDPRKTPEWAAAKRKSLEEHIWASEYDIDYSASVEGICIPGKWVQAAIELGRLLRIEPAAKGSAGLDLGAGKAKSVLAPRFGAVVLKPHSWGNPDTLETAHNAIDTARQITVQRADGSKGVITAIYFDNIGIGLTVDRTLAKTHTQGLRKIGVNVGDSASNLKWPDGEYSHEKFVSLKAELWWLARERFKHAYEMREALQGREGNLYPPDEVIVLPADAMELTSEISLVKWQKTEKGKIQIETKKELAKRGIKSPDHADALMLSFADHAVAMPARPAMIPHMGR